jgi:hypothetical protein
MFVTKQELAERIKQFPRRLSYPATIYVTYRDAESETKGDPSVIEIDVEKEGGTVGFLLQISGSDVEQGRTLARELQQLDQATDVLSKEQ